MGMERSDPTFALAFDEFGQMVRVPRGLGHPLQHGPLVYASQVRPHPLSDVAKMDEQGMPKRGFKRLLPELAWTSFLIAQSQGRPVAPPPENFPYGLKAVGFIDPWVILTRQAGFVSSRFELIP